MRYPLLAALLFNQFIFLFNPTSAQEAILRIRGCGTSCRVETKQLSRPSIMDKRYGWAKVLESETAIMNDHGVDQVISGYGDKQHWFFANCYDSVVGIGQKSDRSDAIIIGIYDRDGKPKIQTSSNNIYNRYHALCDAVDLE